jgi:long-chain acyl-CoA synthetase
LPSLAIGAADVPIYPTLTGEQIAALLRDADCRIAVVSTRQQFDKLNSVRAQTHWSGSSSWIRSAARGRYRFQRADGRRRRARQRARSCVRCTGATAEPTDLATLIYTSGTTGEPKGVALTHGNIASNQNYCRRGVQLHSRRLLHFVPASVAHYGARPGLHDVLLRRAGGLLLAVRQAAAVHERGAAHGDCWRAARVREDSPGCGAEVVGLAGQEAHSGLGGSPGASYRDAVYDGKRPGALVWKLANKLVYSKVSEAFGGRVRVFVSGGAPLGMDTAQWFASVGIAIREGYGLTETSPVISLNNPVVHRMGSVGGLCQMLN